MDTFAVIEHSRQRVEVNRHSLVIVVIVVVVVDARIVLALAFGLLPPLKEYI